MNVAILRSMGGLVFDAVFEESHLSELEVTDNPVETGVVVSDHAFMLPYRCRLVAGVSDTPLKNIPGDQFASSYSRSYRAFQLLNTLQVSAEPFDVVTGLRLYKNMICAKIHAEQDKDSAHILYFIAELREVIIVGTKTVTYSPRQASQRKNRGEVQGKNISSPNKSLQNKIETARRNALSTR